MNRYLSLGFICSLVLVWQIGFCMAADVPGYLAYAQGGRSSIMDGSDGMMMITIQDVIPYFYITDGNQSNMMPVGTLSGYHSPLNTGIIFSGDGNESVSLVSVSNVSFSDGTKTLTFQAKPLEFYDGSQLKPFIREKEKLSNDLSATFSNTSIYIEVISFPPTNGDIQIGNCLIEPC